MRANSIIVLLRLGTKTIKTKMKRNLIFANLLLVAVLAGCGGSAITDNNDTDENSLTIPTTSLYSADTPDGALYLFLEKLGNRDYAGAFELQKNKAWGATVDSFSSPKAFGGVVKTTVLTLEPPKDESGKKMIYAEVTYLDEVNGDKTFKQKFYLQSFGGQWKIVDMKVMTNKNKDTKVDTEIKKDFSGTYITRGEYGPYYDETAERKIIVNYVSNQKYKFSYYWNGKEIISGDINISKNTGKFEKELNDHLDGEGDTVCKFTFIFSENSVEIEDEYGGFEYSVLGMGKTADGIYKKVL